MKLLIHGGQYLTTEFHSLPCVPGLQLPVVQLASGLAPLPLYPETGSLISLVARDSFQDRSSHSLYSPSVPRCVVFTSVIKAKVVPGPNHLVCGFKCHGDKELIFEAYTIYRK